jgi:hypothetical protein
MKRPIMLFLACISWTVQSASFDSVTRVAPSDPFADSSFGFAVAVSGQTLAVGAAGNGEMGMAAGAAYLFVKNGDSWTQEAKLFTSAPQDLQLFGHALAVSGDTVVVSALELLNAQRGSVYVFTRNNGVWTQQQKLLPSDGADFDTFGASVAIDGDTIAVGSYNAGHPTAPYSGSVYIFRTAFPARFTFSEMAAPAGPNWHDSPRPIHYPPASSAPR